MILNKKADTSQPFILRVSVLTYLTNMIKVIILIGIFWLSVYSSCNKNGPCNETVYSFKLNIAANQGIDSIAVNDTLWFKIDESTQLKDFISGKTLISQMQVT
jgi:hypothetical protein